MNREAKICPDCGAPIPDKAPHGLCPKCLLAGAATPTEAGTATETQTAAQAPSVEELARAFPQLEIIGLIGRGGMGYVYRARQPKLERDVALKILPQHLATHPGFAERFAREGRLLAKLNHPNIVSIFDFGESGGFFHLLMEFVDGVNLRQAMRTSRFTATQALTIVPKVCEALQYAHDEGVLHRDIKPENILLDARGRVKIADFGIAKLMERGPASRGTTGTEAALKTAGTHPTDEAAAGHRPALRELTAASSTLGTPQYMAPEQLERPSEVDHRADIYSLGVVFYELLTGELPVGKFAPPSAKTPLDERVDEIVLRALAKEREQRQQSAREMKSEVETVTYGEGLEPRSAGRFWKPDAGTAAAFGLGLYYTGLVGAAPLVEALGGGAWGLPALVLVWVVAVAGIVQWAFGRPEQELPAHRRERLKTWIEGLSVVSAVMCLPVGGFGLFFLGNLIDELTTGRGGWNPAASEAIIVSHAILGLGLLPWAAWKLRRAIAPAKRDVRPASPEVAEDPRHQVAVSVFLVTASLAAVLLALVNPWGPVAWKWFTAACTLGCFIFALWPGRRSTPAPGAGTGAASRIRAGGRPVLLAAFAGALTLVVVLLIWMTLRQRSAAQATEAARAAELALVQFQQSTLIAPVVVETRPASGAREVAPGVTEIHVRFSKPMAAGSWSWSEAWAGSTPELIDAPRYDPERRTCSVRVQLEPGRTYAWWLNSDRFTNFKDTQGNPAVPYLLIFQTRATPGTP